MKERCKELARDIAVLSKGTRFWKVRSGKDWYLRRYWLDVDHLCIRYEPSHKPCWKATPTHGTVDLVFTSRCGYKFLRGDTTGVASLMFSLRYY